MLPSPTMPSVLPRSSLPMNFFFSHLPARVEALACGMWRAMASISARVCSATEMALPPGVFITSTPAAGGGFQIDVIDAHAGAADHAQLGRLVEHRRMSPARRCAPSARRLPPGAAHIPWDWKRSIFQPGWDLKQLDTGRRERLGDQDHVIDVPVSGGYAVAVSTRRARCRLLDGGDAGSILHRSIRWRAE